MATPLPINFAIDVQAQGLGIWPGYISQIPAFFLGNVKDIAVIALQPTGIDTGAAFNQINLAGYAMEVTISATPAGDGSQVVYMAPVTLASNGLAATIFTGQLDFTQFNLSNAMGSASQISATIEFEIVLGGVRQTIFQTAITIFAPADNGAVVNPSPATNYYTAAQANATFVPFNIPPGVGIQFNSQDNTQHKILFLQNDGTWGGQLL
jgi:hypothetical protein